MPTREVYAALPRDQRLKRLARTPDALATAIHDLTDVELAMDDPKVLVVGAKPANSWRLVEHCRAGACPPPSSTNELHVEPACRTESLNFFTRLSSAHWQRACLHPTPGRVTFTDWTALMPVHDDNHFDQLTRAVAGRA